MCVRSSKDMMPKSNQSLLEIVEACVKREIGEANVYHALLFKWNNGLHNLDGFERELGGLFHFVRDALETKYILCLSKLFAPSNEAGLWQLIELTKEVSETWIELKRERYPSFADQSEKDRKEFLQNYDRYEAKIREIKEKINPYRNIQRAHNHPLRNHESKETWDETKSWLTFAETVFVQAMDGICEDCCRVGDFYPAALNGEIEYFIALMDRGLKGDKVAKEALTKVAKEAP